MRIAWLVLLSLCGAACATTPGGSGVDASKRVVVLVDETREAEPLAQPPSVEAAHHFTGGLVAALQQQGWEVVELAPATLVERGDDAVAKLARERGAAWAVSGRVTFRAMAVEGQGILPAGSVFPVTALYEVRLIDAQRARLRTELVGRHKPSSKNLPVVSYDHTTVEVAEQARAELAPKLLEALRAK